MSGLLSEFKRASQRWWAKKPNIPIHEEWYLTLVLTDNGDRVIHETNVRLPEYGEVRVVCHKGRVDFVETTVKEKVE